MAQATPESLARNSSVTRSLSMFAIGLVCLLATASAQTSASADEIPLERCDRLPVVKVRAADTDMRFLLDTGATTMLNLKSFASGRSKQIQVTSWTGTAATSAREVSLPELA